MRIGTATCNALLDFARPLSAKRRDAAVPVSLSVYRSVLLIETLRFRIFLNLRRCSPELANRVRLLIQYS